MKPLSILLLTPALALAQIQAPPLAAIADAQGRLLVVEGLPGALSTRDTGVKGALSAGVSSSLLVWKTADSILSSDGRKWPAPDGPARFAFDAQGNPGAVWFESTQEFCVFRGDVLMPLPFSPDETVRSLAMPSAWRLTILTATRKIDVRPEPFRILSDVPAPAEEESSLSTLPWQDGAPGYLVADAGDGSYRLLKLSTRTVYTVPMGDSTGPLTLSLDNQCKTLAGSTIDFGQAPPGAYNDLPVYVCNQTAAVVTMHVPSVTGAGFSLQNPPIASTDIAPNSVYGLTIRFVPTDSNPYSGQLHINDGVWDLHGQGGSTPVLQRVVNGTTQNIAPNTTIDLGSVPPATSTPFAFSIANITTASMIVSPISLSGAGGRLAGLPEGPLTLLPGTSQPFNLYVESSTPGPLSLTLSVGQFTYPITAVITTGPIPQPILSVTSLASGEQVDLGMTLESPSPVDVDGTLALSFQPATGLAPDPTIEFLPAGLTKIPFHLTAGSTAASFGGAATVSLQTGATAGVLTFSISAGTSSWQQSFTLAPEPIRFDSVQGALSDTSVGVYISGMDNTRSAAKVTFTFSLTDGTRLAAGPIDVDVSAAFKQYYAANPGAAGTFLLQVQFPVTGTASLLGSVDIAFANGNGAAPTRASVSLIH